VCIPFGKHINRAENHASPGEKPGLNYLYEDTMSQLNTQEEPGLITANSSAYQAHDIETRGKIKKV
jgi:hypothetical protein